VAWEDAVHEAAGGCSLDVEVTPGARSSAFPSGHNAWRGRLEARVRAPPEGGQANEELCALVADALGVPRPAVRMGAGATSRRKTLLVAGCRADEARRRLRGRMAAGEKL
jgi:uncharacterized protein (TIGR00251 family)